MTKETLKEAEGVVSEVLPDAHYRVRLDDGSEVMAYASGRIRKSRVRIFAGDRVTVEMSLHDLTHARINLRHKDEQPTSTEPRRRPQRRWR